MITCLIPHAGKSYAGDCRANVFKTVQSLNKRVQHILFIAAVHETHTESCVYNDTLHIFKNIPNKYIQTHTWEWVKDEIYEYFPNATVTLLFPNDTYKLPVSTIRNLKNFLVIGTTDLIHNTNNMYTWYDKVYLEEIMINKFLNNRLANKSLYCGLKSVRCLFQINRYYNLHGIVVDYYDSTQSQYSGIQRYTYKPMSKFVSYVGIVYTKN